VSQIRAKRLKLGFSWGRKTFVQVKSATVVADLSGAILIGTDFTGATLINCKIYGIAAWSVELKEAKQKNLVITNVR
jgi:uncharacterized protein YjbI with pentapeptide repeats